MSKFSTEAKVGVLVLVGIILLGYMTLKLGRFQIGADKGILVTAVFDTASGLKKGVPVEVAGIEIGTVEDITLQQGRALVTLKIRSDLDLGSDSQAIIRTAGVLGDKYVEIIPGLTGAPPLKDGDQIVRTIAPADVDQIIMKIGEISDDIKKVTKSLTDVFGGPEGAADMRQILNNLRDMSKSLNKIILENQEDINSLIKSLTAFSKDIQNISSKHKEDIEAILVNFRRSSEELTKTITAARDITEQISQGKGTLGKLFKEETTIDNLNQTLASLKEAVQKINRGEGALGKLLTDTETSQDVTQALASLRDISEKISQGQGTIGRLINDETTVEKVDEALSGLNKAITKIDTFRLYVDYHSDYMFDYSEAKSYLNFKLQPREDKYYLVGLVDDPRGVYHREIRTVTGPAPGDSATTTIAQFAKRYYDLVIRAGIFESAAGIGTDYYLLDDKVRLTFEMFDFSSDIGNVHLKLGAYYDFLNFFYLSAGYDDIANSDFSSWYLGLGLKFSDDDLKYLLGNIPLP
ncbi:MAG: MCE family protein [Deltaproteobacteria bacterium]|nr:MCE family protein [Deltaproteobacteria bacterium]